MQYKLHLNLRRTAALTMATSFWIRAEVKDKADELLRSSDNLAILEARTKWDEFTKKVIDEWDKDLLPQILEIELVHLVRMTGQAIFNWYQYMKHECKTRDDAINCIEEIKWTPYGTVDVVGIFKSSWLDNPNFDIIELYDFACRYAIDDHINDLWNKIPLPIQANGYMGIYEDFDQHILAYWQHCRGSHLSHLIVHFEVNLNNFNGQDLFNLLYDMNRSTEENMLRLTVYQGHFIAMKYFWEKLTEDERQESVLKCARIAVWRYNYYAVENESNSEYKMCQCIEICIFLMNHMTSSDKKLFFNEQLELETYPLYSDERDVKSQILGMLMSTWPWQELFIPVFEDLLKHQDENSKMDCTFLDAITFYMLQDYELGYSIEASKYQYLLRKVWLIMPVSFKQTIVQENPHSAFINNLIDVWDLDNLNLIINDPEIATVRDKLINLGLFSYEKFIVYEKFDKLNRLLVDVFKFDEEKKKSFKQEICPWFKIFRNYKFNIADKFLDLQSSTPKERKVLKNNIDHIELCKKFIDINDYELLDKFLDWKFDTIEERLKCEDYFKNDIFVIKQIYEIWRLAGEIINDPRQESSKFLDWVFESYEEVRYFKRDKLVNIEIGPIILNSLVMLQLTGRIDEFLTWCLLVDEREICRIKRLVSEQINLL